VQKRWRNDNGKLHRRQNEKWKFQPREETEGTKKKKGDTNLKYMQKRNDKKEE